MGLGAEMKSLSEELLASFKQRIKENEELVNDVQKTLEGFNKDHQEMTAVLNANAAALRKGLAKGEKERLNTYKDLMKGIHLTMASIQAEVREIQASTLNMVNQFSTERAQMSVEQDISFAQGRAERAQHEKTRIKEFKALMKGINDDIKTINDEVLSIFKNTNDLLEKFDKEHMDMSAELRAELGKNLVERVEYTRSLLAGFQKRLAEISKENQKMANKLRKDLANGETERLSDFQAIMKGIHTAIKTIRKEVKDIQKSTFNMLGDLTHERVVGMAEWTKMQDAMAQIRKTGLVKSTKEPAKKQAPVEAKKEAPVEAKKEAPAEHIIEFVAPVQPKQEPNIEAPLSLETKVLNYINQHPKGVKISEMEVPLGETRMKLGFVARNLLDENKVQKVENVYFPLK